MKKEIHPQYRDVVIQDLSSGATFLTGSAGKTDDEIKWEDGKTYPLFKVEISSASHPFFTGKQNLIDKAGRVEKFSARMAASQAKKETIKTPRKRKDSSQ